jgi:hypothetical protein
VTPGILLAASSSTTTTAAAAAVIVGVGKVVGAIMSPVHAKLWDVGCYIASVVLVGCGICNDRWDAAPLDCGVVLAEELCNVSGL